MGWIVYALNNVNKCCNNNFNKTRDKKEIKITLSKLHHLHSGLGHTQVGTLMPFSNLFCNK
jgi:hypothetical protein